MGGLGRGWGYDAERTVTTSSAAGTYGRHDVFNVFDPSGASVAIFRGANAHRLAMGFLRQENKLLAAAEQTEVETGKAEWAALEDRVTALEAAKGGFQSRLLYLEADLRAMRSALPGLSGLRGSDGR